MKGSSPNHPFSGAMLVLGSVYSGCQDVCIEKKIRTKQHLLKNRKNIVSTQIYEQNLDIKYPPAPLPPERWVKSNPYFQFSFLKTGCAVVCFFLNCVVKCIFSSVIRGLSRHARGYVKLILILIPVKNCLASLALLEHLHICCLENIGKLWLSWFLGI